MSTAKIAGILRQRDYSPNHIGNDAAIMNAVRDQLRKRGCEVTLYSEEQFGSMDDISLSELKKMDCILSMCRSPKCVDRLKQLEKEGVYVENSGSGIENCRRERMSRILVGHAIPYPVNFTVDTDKSMLSRLQELNIGKCWIKQADFHSMHKEDVTFVRHAEEAQEVLHEYFLRGIRRAVINEHVVGDLIRFYGVRGMSFFHCFLPMDARNYGTDVPDNTDESKTGLNHTKLKNLCERAAEALEIEVYGGDCMLLPSGDFMIIDVNDWPSFAPCRKEASSAIARHVLRK
ncbi:MAG: hypothetical protein K2L69_05860, partial [Muribaculaceae bacterium]|nr:hypothetical protein [Muribaculaceae bacterium]